MPDLKAFLTALKLHPLPLRYKTLNPTVEQPKNQKAAFRYFLSARASLIRDRFNSPFFFFFSAN